VAYSEPFQARNASRVIWGAGFQQRSPSFGAAQTSAHNSSSTSQSFISGGEQLISNCKVAGTCARKDACASTLAGTVGNSWGEHMRSSTGRAIAGDRVLGARGAFSGNRFRGPTPSQATDLGDRGAFSGNKFGGTAPSQAAGLWARVRRVRVQRLCRRQPHLFATVTLSAYNRSRGTSQTTSLPIATSGGRAHAGCKTTWTASQK